MILVTPLTMLTLLALLTRMLILLTLLTLLNAVNDVDDVDNVGIPFTNAVNLTRVIENNNCKYLTYFLKKILN